jgi:serine/threonine protein phosphatase PrpC
MNIRVFGESVQGASHKLTGKPCQDSCKSCKSGEAWILAVADGHGSDSCPYSDKGAEFAVEVFCEAVDFYCPQSSEDTERLPTFLNREGDTKIAQFIDKQWKERVLDDYKANVCVANICVRNDDEQLKGEEIWRQYGTTLLGLVLAPSFIFAFQLGDGDIAYADDSGVSLLIEPEKILGTETHSLSKPDSWKKAITLTKRVEHPVSDPCAFVMTTDGFANSYATHNRYIESLRGYFAAIKEHGPDKVKDSLKQWLEQTSAKGCGDDITMLIAYCCSDERRM